MNAFGTFEDIVCILGDTLPPMTITVDEMDQRYSMKCRVFSLQNRQAVIEKDCTQTETGFAVQLTSTDMAIVTVGQYWLDFALEDASGYVHKKLRGKLIVVEG
jgi:hypothetical protein